MLQLPFLAAHTYKVRTSCFHPFLLAAHHYTRFGMASKCAPRALQKYWQLYVTNGRVDEEADQQKLKEEQQQFINVYCGDLSIVSDQLQKVAGLIGAQQLEEARNQL